MKASAGAFVLYTLTLLQTIGCAKSGSQTPTDITQSEQTQQQGATASTADFVVKLSHLKTPPTAFLNLWNPLSNMLFGEEAFAHGGTAGSPLALTIKIYALYGSSHADCSEMELLSEYPSGDSFAAFENPTIFTATRVSTAVYRCLAIKLSDQIRFTADSVAEAHFPGSCVTNSAYLSDFYREGATVVNKNIFGETTMARGTDLTPIEDDLLILFSTDTSAAINGPIHPSISHARALESDVTLPSTRTFYTDFSNHLNARSSTCVADAHYPFGMR